MQICMHIYSDALTGLRLAYNGNLLLIYLYIFVYIHVYIQICICMYMCINIYV